MTTIIYQVENMKVNIKIKIDDDIKFRIIR